MSLFVALANLESTLRGDPDLLAWAQDWGGQSLTVLHGGRKVDSIDMNDLPVLVMEIGTGTFQPNVGGNDADAAPTIAIGIGWLEEDPARAFAARVSLIELMPRVLMRNDTLNDSVLGIHVQSFESDGGANAPAHFVNFTLSAELSITL